MKKEFKKILDNPELLLNKFLLIDFGCNYINANLYFVYKVENNKIFYYHVRFWDGDITHYFFKDKLDYIFNEYVESFLIF